MGDILVD